MRESNLLNYIYAATPTASPTAGQGNVELGPGDDMGIVRIANERILLAVDQVIDGVHFDLQTASIQRIGRKALTRNLSDVAAMAAKPTAALVSASLPKDFGEGKAQELFDAIKTTGQEFECPIIGGDISIIDGKLSCSITIIAGPAGIEPVLRKGAEIGDYIYVTGALGGSLEEIDGYIHNLDFTPQLKVARTLAANKKTRPKCMMDISDGLGKDLERLCKAAEKNIGADIEIDKLPISSSAQQAATRSKKQAWEHAIGDGEDYQLLFTAPKNSIPEKIKNTALTCIGKIVAKKENKPCLRFIRADGSAVEACNTGWEHTGNNV